MKRIVPMIGVLMLASTAWAQVSLNVVWTDLTFRGGGTNEAQSVAFNRNRVIAGEVLGAPGGGTDGVVRGYNANTGNIVWEDTIMGGAAVLVDASGNDSFAAVRIPVPNSLDSHVLVRSYQQRTGDIQWSTTVPLDGIRAFAVRGNRVILVGPQSDRPNGDNGQLFVWARATGNLLWTATLEGDPHPPITQAEFWDVDRTGTDLVVVGEQFSMTSTGEQRHTMVLRDYRVSDGHLKWETIEPGMQSLHLELANGLVYVSGGTFSPDGVPTGGVMAAYRLLDGVSLWKDASPLPPTAFTVSDGAIYVGLTQLTETSFIQRRDAFTGRLVWELPIPPETDHSQFIQGIGIVHGYIVVVGTSVTRGIILPLTSRLIVRVVDEHGTLILEDKSDPNPRAQFEDHAIEGHRVVGVGTITGLTGGAFVRMYELQTGVAP